MEVRNPKRQIPNPKGRLRFSRISSLGFGIWDFQPSLARS
jgi:hypothetical protein